jgi:uncharacterized membrane protein
MTRVNSKCVSLFITLFCLLNSFICLILFIHFSNFNKYEFLGEIALYLLLLSILSSVIYVNIKKNNNSITPDKKTSTTKVMPIL